MTFNEGSHIDSSRVQRRVLGTLPGRSGASSGPTAGLYVLAHEYGHPIDNQLGVFDVANRADAGAITI